MAFVLMLVPHFAQATAGSSAPSETVAIIEDHDSKSFRFVIEGKEVARLDQSGLHVRESIAYGGAITDVGIDNYDKEPTAPQGAAE
ncbi:MAG: hypothetical protein C0511_14425 [Hyphomicrobium sp.]|nr:hypothetical protein [Hyphomicrobium sp.]